MYSWICPETALNDFRLTVPRMKRGIFEVRQFQRYSIPPFIEVYGSGFADPYLIFYGMLFGLGVAVPAVDGSAAPRLEGHFRLFTARSTGSRVHLTGAASVVVAATAS